LDTEKRGQLRIIISPDGENGSLSVCQDVRVYAGLFDGGESSSLKLASNRFAYIHVARGEAMINGIRFDAGDGARVRGEPSIDIKEGKDAEMLIFDLRANELPSR